MAKSHLPDTVKSAVYTLQLESDPTFLKHLKETPRASLRLYHLDWGPKIQNRFGLDGKNDELLDDCRRIYALRMRNRYSEFELERLSDVKLLMPQGSAFIVILESLWEKLQAS